MLYKPRTPSLFDRADAFNPLTSELRGLWCFETRHAADLSQYQAQAASVVNPTWSPRGGVLWNADGYIDCGDKEQYRYSDAGNPLGFTAEAIFTLDQHVNGEFPRIFSKLSNWPFDGYELLVRAPDEATFTQWRRHIYLQIGNGGTLGQYNGAEIIAGKRHHVIVSKTAGGVPRFFLDGVEWTDFQFGSSTTIAATSAPLVIGAWAGPLNSGIRGSIEKVALYGRALPPSDIQRLFTDPYWHFATRKAFYFGIGVESFFDWTAAPENTYEPASQSGEMVCDASPACTWSAPQPGSFWTVEGAPGAEFTGRVGAAGRFDCAAPETAVEFFGRNKGAVTWRIDAPPTCEWIIGAAVVKKDCLAGDGRYQATPDGEDVERNYVF